VAVENSTTVRRLFAQQQQEDTVCLTVATPSDIVVFVVKSWLSQNDG